MDHTRARIVRKNEVLIENTKSISQVLTDFCQNTSGHGFQYWVSASTYFERTLWVCIVACGFTFASIMVSSALSHWFKNPSSVAIRTFSKPAREVEFPAITICNEKGFDVGEYIRAVFDNFQYKCEKDYNCNETELLRSHFPAYFDKDVLNSSGSIVSFTPGIVTLYTKCKYGISFKLWTFDKFTKFHPSPSNLQNMEANQDCVDLKNSLLPHLVIPMVMANQGSVG